MRHGPSVGRFWLGLLALCWVGQDCPGLLHSPRPPPPPPAPASERLLDRLLHAVRIHDTTEIDLGLPLPRGTLVRGWSWNEQWPSGGSGNWAVQTEAEIAFPLVVRAPRRFTLWLGGPPDSGPPQTVRVLLNGHQAEHLVLDRELRRHDFSVPARFLHPGMNRLVLQFSRLSAPIGGRSLAAVLDKVLIKPDSESGWQSLRPVQVVPEDFAVEELLQEPGRPRALSQPGDTWLEFGLLPRPGAVLRFLRQTEAEGGRTVAVATVQACRDSDAGEVCRELMRMPVLRPEPAAWVEERCALPDLESQPLRLRFTVEGTLASLGQGWPGQIWGEPEVLSQAPAPVFTLHAGAAASRPSAEPSQGGSGGGVPRKPASVRHVLVYMVDTLRPDRLVDPDLALPNLQRLLRGGLWEAEAWATSSWTKPSTATLLTSVPPSQHGAVSRSSRLRPGVRTLAAWLGQHGVASGAFVANGNVAAEFGFGAGFDRYQHVFAAAPQVHAAALGWLRQAGDAPSFTYLHLIDPHDPYQPRAPWPRLLGLDRYTGPLDGSNETLHRLARQEISATEEDRRHIEGLYRAEIRQLDTAFGELLDGLNELGRLESTAILLVSDHGEEFEEHGGWLHGSSLEPEQTAVLLGLWLPGQRAGRLQGTSASLYDVAPTVCELLGIPAAPEFLGQPLGTPRPAAPVLMELALDGIERMGAIGPDWAYSFSTGVNHAPRLHARLADPGHLVNLASALPVTAEALEQGHLLRQPSALPAFDHPPVESHELAPETIEQLRSMGYLEP